MITHDIPVPWKRAGTKLPLFVTLLVVTVCFSSISLVAEEMGWQPVLEVEGIKVYKRDKKSSRLFEFKAVGNLRGTVSQYASVLLETESMPQWAPLCIEAHDIEKINDRETIIYVACKGVWPVADREYTARRAFIAEPDVGSIRVDLERVDHQSTRNVDRRVEIPHLKSHWILQEIDSTQTHVELYVDVDPGGWLPAWLVNFGYQKVPYRFLKELETQVVNGFRHMPAGVTASLDPKDRYREAHENVFHSLH